MENSTKERTELEHLGLGEQWQAEAEAARPHAGEGVRVENSKSESTDDSHLAMSDFAGLAARIATSAAGWAADALQSHSDLSLPMSHATVRRFAEDMITRVHRITEIAQNGR